MADSANPIQSGTPHPRPLSLMEQLLAESRESQHALELANHRLQEQAVEYEVQAEELQTIAAQLEERTLEAESASAAARESERQLRTMVDALPTLAWTARADGYIDWYNARWYEYTGKTAADMEGWGWESVHDPAMLPSVLERWRQSIATGEAFEMTFPLLGADGQFCAFLTRVVPIADQAGSILRWFGTNTNIEAEHAVRLGAERASRAKSDFLATMSHELRTPLNAIGGYVELLELGIRGPITDAQRDDLSRIQRSQRHLLGLINDVLNFARLEANGVTYNLQDVSLRATVNAVEPLVEPQLRKKSLRWARPEPSDDVHVRADEDKLRQVLLNLVANAIKFTPISGEITLTWEPSTDMVRLHVADTGSGIPADRLDDIFAPFVQIERRLNSAHEGAGLGLAISRDLARGMGGDLTVASTLGLGSTFTLSLLAAK